MPTNNLEKDQKSRYRVIGNQINYEKNKYYRLDHRLSHDEFEQLVLLTYEHLENRGEAGQKILANNSKLIAFSRSVCFYLEEILHDVHDENCIENAYKKKLSVDFNKRTIYPIAFLAITLGLLTSTLAKSTFALTATAVIIGEGTIFAAASVYILRRLFEQKIKERDLKDLKLKKLEKKLDAFAELNLQD